MLWDIVLSIRWFTAVFPLLVVAAVLGLIACLLFVAACLWCVCRRRRRNSPSSLHRQTSISYLLPVFLRSQVLIDRLRPSSLRNLSSSPPTTKRRVFSKTIGGFDVGSSWSRRIVVPYGGLSTPEPLLSVGGGHGTGSSKKWNKINDGAQRPLTPSAPDYTTRVAVPWSAIGGNGNDQAARQRYASATRIPQGQALPTRSNLDGRRVSDVNTARSARKVRGGVLLYPDLSLFIGSARRGHGRDDVGGDGRDVNRLERQRLIDRHDREPEGQRKAAAIGNEFQRGDLVGGLLAGRLAGTKPVGTVIYI